MTWEYIYILLEIYLPSASCQSDAKLYISCAHPNQGQENLVEVVYNSQLFDGHVYATALDL